MWKVEVLHWSTGVLREYRSSGRMSFDLKYPTKEERVQIGKGVMKRDEGERYWQRRQIYMERKDGLLELRCESYERIWDWLKQRRHRVKA